MKALIGADMLSQGLIYRDRDGVDELWCDDLVLTRGEPVFAFRIKNKGVALGPYGGICIILGGTPTGDSRPPHLPIGVLEQAIDWLGEIIPQVDTVQEDDESGVVHIRHVVTYKRP